MKDILKIIKKYSIHSERDLHKLGPRFIYFLSDICNAIAGIKNKKVASCFNGLNLDLILNKSTMSILSPNKLSTLGKKLFVYSANSVIEIPRLEVDQTGKKAYDYSRLKKDNEYRYKKINQFFNHFLSPYIALKDCIEQDMVLLLPKGFSVVSFSKDFSSSHRKTPIRQIRKSFKIDKIKRSDSLVDDSFKVIYPSRRDLLANLFEDKNIFENPSQIHLLLPYIKNIDEYTLAKIKEEYFDQLIMFYRCAEKLFEDSKATDSESKLLDLMKQVDYEVRKMCKIYEGLVEKRKSRGIELCLGMSIMALSLLCPAELSQSILTAVGGTKALKGVWYLLDHKDNFNQMKKCDFFVPWYINRLSK